MAAKSKVASEDIPTCRFMTLDPAKDNLAKLARPGDTTPIWGISAYHTRKPPMDGFDADLTAAAGEGVSIQGEEKQHPLLRLAGPAKNGDLLGPDGTEPGSGIVVTASGVQYGAVCLQMGVKGDYVEVEFRPGFIG